MSEHSHRPPLGALLAVPLAVALALTLFAWPSGRMRPRDVPVGVAGPPAATQPIEGRLAEQGGAFEVHSYADGAAARRAIEDRRVYGAFVVKRGGAPQVLVASAASPPVAQSLREAAAAIRTPQGATRVVDVVPATSAAPALPSSVLPLVLAGMLAAVIATQLAAGALRESALLLAAAALAGLAGIAIIQGWLGVVRGPWLVNAGVLGLTVLGVAATVAGLRAALGIPGAVTGALTMVLVGNPFSAAGTAPELLPEPAGTIGQLLPPGAGANLLRSTGYFDGAGAGGHLIVLLAWAGIGLTLLVVADARARRAPVTSTLRPAAS